MTKQEYQDLVEKKFGKPLKDIMYDLCVIQDVVASEGASILDVPKDVFTYWRNKFRFGRNQLLCDKTEKLNTKKMIEYAVELSTVDLTREFEDAEVPSLEGFREVLERYLELEKAKRVLYAPNELETLSYDINIEFLRFAIRYLDSYCSGKLHSDFERKAQYIQDEMKRT